MAVLRFSYCVNEASSSIPFHSYRVLPFTSVNTGGEDSQGTPLKSSSNEGIPGTDDPAGWELPKFQPFSPLGGWEMPKFPPISSGLWKSRSPVMEVGVIRPVQGLPKFRQRFIGIPPLLRTGLRISSIEQPALEMPNLDLIKNRENPLQANEETQNTMRPMRGMPNDNVIPPLTEQTLGEDPSIRQSVGEVSYKEQPFEKIPRLEPPVKKIPNMEQPFGEVPNDGQPTGEFPNIGPPIRELYTFNQPIGRITTKESPDTGMPNILPTQGIPSYLPDDWLLNVRKTPGLKNMIKNSKYEGKQYHSTPYAHVQAFFPTCGSFMDTSQLPGRKRCATLRLERPATVRSSPFWGWIKGFFVRS